jgi:hypothetical protein
MGWTPERAGTHSTDGNTMIKTLGEINRLPHHGAESKLAALDRIRDIAGRTAVDSWCSTVAAAQNAIALADAGVSRTLTSMPASG